MLSGESIERLDYADYKTSFRRLFLLIMGAETREISKHGMVVAHTGKSRGGNTMERAAIFVDGSYLYKRLKSIAGKARIKWEPFAKKLCGDRRLASFNYYNVPLRAAKDPIKYAKQQKMFASIQAMGGRVTLGRMIERQGVWFEKGVDVNLAVEMVILGLQDEYDTAILVSADGDFTGAIESVKQFFNKKVEVIFIGNRTSWHLKQASDGHAVLDTSFFEDLWEYKSY